MEIPFILQAREDVCDTRVKKYMNELRPCLNERNSESRMVKKCLKELKVTHFFRLLDPMNYIVKRVLLETILCWVVRV